MTSDFHIPTTISFTVLQTSANTDSRIENDHIIASQTFSLVLRYSGEENIKLSGGAALSDIPLHFTLSTKWKKPEDLAFDLADGSLGFLVHTRDEHDRPRLHGAALLTDSNILTTLLSSTIRGSVNLTLPTLPPTDSCDSPFIWGINRAHRLEISSFQIAAIPQTISQKI